MPDGSSVTLTALLDTTNIELPASPCRTMSSRSGAYVHSRARASSVHCSSERLEKICTPRSIASATAGSMAFGAMSSLSSVTCTG